MNRNRNQLPNRWIGRTPSDRTHPVRGSFFERHKRLIYGVAGAVIVFIVLHKVWFFVMGGFAVIGVIWAIREYNNNEQ